MLLYLPIRLNIYAFIPSLVSSFSHCYLLLWFHLLIFPISSVWFPSILLLEILPSCQYPFFICIVLFIFLVTSLAFSLMTSVTSLFNFSMSLFPFIFVANFQFSLSWIMSSWSTYRTQTWIPLFRFFLVELSKCDFICNLLAFNCWSWFVVRCSISSSGWSLVGTYTYLYHI